MIILDTNVLSAMMNDVPDDAVARWLDRQPRSTIWSTTVTLFEVRLGLLTMPAGRRQDSLRGAFQRCIDVILEARIADFTMEAAEETAILAAQRRRDGRPHELRDSMIAGIAIAHRGTLATRNTRHFADLPVPVIDPWVA